MRVLVVPSWYPTEKAPLQGIFVEDQVRLFAREQLGVEMHVAAFGERLAVSPRIPLASLSNLYDWFGSAVKWRQDDTKSGGLTVHRSAGVDLSERLAAGGRMLEVKRLISLARSIYQLHGRIDLVHAHVSYPAGFVAVEAAKALGLPVIVSEHMSPFPLPDLIDSQGRVDSRVIHALRNADLVTAVSRAHAADVALACGREVEVMHNFVDGIAFSPPNARSGPHRIISVGHLVPQKGFDLLLRAFAKARGEGLIAQLTIAGEGPSRTELEELTARLGLSNEVRFHGVVSREELPDLLRRASAFVLASRHESFGVVIIEALATGLPALVTACGGPEEIVDQDETGLIVRKDDVDALAAGLISLCARSWDSALIRQRFEDRFSGRAMAASWLTRYEGLLNDVGESG